MSNIDVIYKTVKEVVKNKNGQQGVIIRIRFSWEDNYYLVEASNKYDTTRTVEAELEQLPTSKISGNRFIDGLKKRLKALALLNLAITFELYDMDYRTDNPIFLTKRTKTTIQRVCELEGIAEHEIMPVQFDHFGENVEIYFFSHPSKNYESILVTGESHNEYATRNLYQKLKLKSKTVSALKSLHFVGVIQNDVYSTLVACTSKAVKMLATISKETKTNDYDKMFKDLNIEIYTFEKWLRELDPNYMEYWRCEGLPPPLTRITTPIPSLKPRFDPDNLPPPPQMTQYVFSDDGCPNAKKQKYDDAFYN